MPQIPAQCSGGYSSPYCAAKEFREDLAFRELLVGPDGGQEKLGAKAVRLRDLFVSATTEKPGVDVKASNVRGRVAANERASFREWTAKLARTPDARLVLVDGGRELVRMEVRSPIAGRTIVLDQPLGVVCARTERRKHPDDVAAAL